MTIYYNKKLEKTMKSISVYLSEEEYDKVYQAALKDDRNMASYIRTLIRKETM